MSFPFAFFAVLVLGAVAMAALGAATLLALWLRDHRRGDLW
jgi:hypothetical protein